MNQFPPPPPGSLIPLNSEVVNVRDGQYGAKGDGFTDDTAAIQRTIDHVISRGGGIVFLPAGFYIASQLTVSGPIMLMGVGASSVIEQKANTDAHLISCTAAGSRLAIRDLEIDGNWQNQTNDGTHIYYSINFRATGQAGNPSRLSVDRCSFVNGRASNVVVMVPDTVAVLTYVEITNSYFLGGCEGSTDLSANCIGIQGTAHSLIDGNTFNLLTTPTGHGRAGVIFSEAIEGTTNRSQVTVTNNEFTNLGRCSGGGVLGCIDCYSGAENVIITDNRLIEPYGRGIDVKSDAIGVIIANNEIQGLNATVAEPNMTGQITCHTSVSSVVGGEYTVYGNICRDSGAYAINVVGRNDAGDAFAGHCVVALNTVTNPVDYCLYAVDWDTIEVKGNSFKGGSSGVTINPPHTLAMVTDNFLDATQGIAIMVQGTALLASADLFVTGNQILNPTGRGIYVTFVGDCTVVNNRIAVTGNEPIYLLNVSGTRFVKNNSIASNTGVQITDATNTGALLADFLNGTSFSLQYPDLTTVGGNARGTRAVDLQQLRTAATQVAGGNDSWALGRSNTASASDAGCLGATNVASAAGAIAIGSINTASGVNSLASGSRADTKSRIGFSAWASGRFGGNGDAQVGTTVLRAATTSTSATRMTADGAAAGSTNIVNLVNSSALLLNIDLVVRDTVTGDVATFRSESILIANLSNTVSLTGAPVFTNVFSSAGFAAIAAPTIAADNTNKGLDITVVALGTNSTHWVATVTVVEVQ
ncbi:MAG: NosD domain-containing protein [Pirellulales bacterium]